MNLHTMRLIADMPNRSRDARSTEARPRPAAQWMPVVIRIAPVLLLLVAGAGLFA